MAGVDGISARDFDNEAIIRLLKCSPDGMLVNLPFSIQQAHSGKFFYISRYEPALATSGNLDILLVTGTTSPHIAIVVDASSAGTLSIYEAVTTSANGTGLTIFNCNRTSAKFSNAIAYYAPTVTSTGLAIMPQKYIAGGTTGSALGGSSTDFARIPEFLLKPSTKYLFRFNNLSAQSDAVSMQIGWFEDV